MKKFIALLCLLAVFATPTLLAQSADDGVTVKDGKIYDLKSGQLTPLVQPETMPFDVWVNTNCDFKVGEGKLRKLGEGQIIRNDGWLVSPDGSVQPVYDHVVMQAAKVIVVRDGDATPISQTMNFPNGLAVDPDGMCTYSAGQRSRLIDGQMFKLDGTGIQPKDTATFKNGRVVLQRQGALVTINSNQLMGMSDGSKVHGDGRIERTDGSVTKMVEGQTVLFDGLPPRN